MPKNTSTFNNTIKDFELIRKYVHSIFLNPSRPKSAFEEDFGIKSSSFRDMISRIQNYMDGAHIKTHSLPGKKGKDNNQAFHFVGNPYNTPVHYLADIFSNASYTLNEMQFYFAFLMTSAEISNDDIDAFDYSYLIDAMNSRISMGMEYTGIDSIEEYFQNKLSSANTQKAYWNKYIQQGYLIPVTPEDDKTRAWDEQEYHFSNNFEPIDDEELLNKLYILIMFFYHEMPYCIPGYYLYKSLKEYISTTFKDTVEIESFHLSQENPYFQFINCSRQSVLENDILWRLIECIDEVKPITLTYAGPFMEGKITLLPAKIAGNNSDGRLYIWGYDYSKKEFSFYRLDHLSYPSISNIPKDKWYDIDPLNGENDPAKIKTLLSNLYVEGTKYLWTINSSGFDEPIDLLIHFTFPAKSFKYYLSKLNREKKHGVVTDLGDNSHVDFSIQITDIKDDPKLIPHSILPWLRTYEGLFSVDEKVCPDLAEYFQNPPAPANQKKNITKLNCATEDNSKKHPDFKYLSLFNEFFNKDFLWLRNYTNTCCYIEDILGETSFFSREQIVDELTGGSAKSREQKISQESLKAILNEAESPTENLYVLSEEDNEYVPLAFYNAGEERRLPILISTAEKAWLKYVLNDPKAKLFLSEDEISTICDIFDPEISLPSLEDYFEIFGGTKAQTYPASFVQNFGILMEAIRDSRYIQATNHTSRGDITSKLVPYRIIYNRKLDLFSLACYSPESDRPIKITINKLSDIELLETVSDEDINKASLFKSKHSDEPIIIEINNVISAYNRAAFLFSDNDTYAVQSDENDQIYRLYIDFYSSEKREILDKIKSLGQYATIISCPDDGSFS